MKESTETLQSRLMSFFNYNFSPEKFPVIQKLFASETFQNAAKSVCPVDKQVTDTFQFNVILQVCILNVVQVEKKPLRRRASKKSDTMTG